MEGYYTENEKIAMQLKNAEGSDGIVVDMSGRTDKDLQRDKAIRNANKEIEMYAEKFEEHTKNLEENALKVADNIQNIEIMPIGNYVLCKQFKDNPFQRIVRDSKSGFIIDTGGINPIYKNTDSGEWEEEKSIIKVGVIQEIGPECKWCRVGDTIMYTEMSAVPVPFYKQNLQLVNETRILVTINEGLKERFKNVV